jgi:hypothetical protein
MPYVPSRPDRQPLIEALTFIEGQDRCTRAEAFEQFRQMAEDGIIRAFWADPKPAPRSVGPSPTQPSEHIGPYPGDWHTATLQDDNRVRFHRRPSRPVLVSRTYFLVAWETHQSKAAPKRTPGPTPGTVDRFAAADRALYPELDRLINDPDKPMTVTAAAAQLAREEKIAGSSTPESRAKRLADRYRRERPRN